MSWGCYVKESNISYFYYIFIDATPWNELDDWTENSPWSEWIPANFTVGDRWAKPASKCFEANLDADGNRIVDFYDFDANGKIHNSTQYSGL